MSELDDLAFVLGAQGYFGSGVKQFVKSINEAKFLREEPTSSSPFADVRKYANVAGVFAVLIAMAAVFTNLAIRQDEGNFSIPHISVEFGDEVLSYLGLFNGFYEAHEMGGQFHRRLVYQQVGVDDGHSGKLGYCLDLGDEESSEGWVFFVDSDDPCANHIARSEATNTFDVLEAGDMQWYTKDGLPLDYFEVTRLFSSSQNYWFGSYIRWNRTCEEVDLSGSFTDLTGARSQKFFKLPVDIDESQMLDATLAHPIYLGESSLEAVLFTGRRWVLIDGNKIPNLKVYRTGASWDMVGVREFFYDKREFNPTEQTDGWVLLVSEIVEAATDSGTPLGLQWFNPRYELDSTYNVPFADLTRPQAAKMGCARCDENSYPCAHQGTCSDGICTCANRATGSLCQIVPQGDGFCDEYFNNEAYEWDGGDCCGSTCGGGPFCGTNGLTTAFGADPKLYGEFRKEWESMVAKGFENCKDPDMVTFTIEMFRGTDPFPDELERCLQDSVGITCDSKIYLQAPSTFPLCSSNHQRIQTVQLPKGAECTLSRVVNAYYGSLFDIIIYYGNGTDSDPIRWGDNYTSQVKWSVPEKCIMEVLSKHLETVPLDWSYQGNAVALLSEDKVATFLCQSDEDLLLERYALSVLYQTSFLLHANWTEHQCNAFGFALDGSIIKCNEEDRVVEYIGYNFWEGELLPEIRFLSKLGESLVLFLSFSFLRILSRSPLKKT